MLPRLIMGGQFAYRSVKGNQDTLQFYVFNGVGSFVSLGQDAANTWSVGFMKGWVPNNDTDGTQGWTNLSTPYFFVDRWRNGVHNFKYFTPAAGNHQYMAFLFHNSATGTNTMYAIIDSTTLQTSLSGYTYAACVASGQTETHDTQDHMNHHFSNMKAGTLWLLFSPFQNDAVRVDEHYSMNPNPPTTEWWATGGL
jgi:hypothetical protein